MGNYGNTVDRWYRRAAVVVWPKEKSFAARAEAGSAWALKTLLNRIDVGDLEGARSDAASLEPTSRRPVNYHDGWCVSSTVRATALRRISVAETLGPGKERRPPW